MSYDDDTLLEYEAEDEDAATDQVAVKVCVDGLVTTVATVPQHLDLYTVVLTSDQPFLQLLAFDPLRVRASVQSLDQDVVLTHYRQGAMDPSNRTAALDRPTGRVLPGCGSELEITSIDEVWVTTGSYPARVTVLVERRTS